MWEILGMTKEEYEKREKKEEEWLQQNPKPEKPQFDEPYNPTQRDAFSKFFSDNESWWESRSKAFTRFWNEAEEASKCS